MPLQQTEKKSGFPPSPTQKTRTPHHMLAKPIVFFTIISKATFYTLDEPGIDCKGARIRCGLGLELFNLNFQHPASKTANKFEK